MAALLDFLFIRNRQEFFVNKHYVVKHMDVLSGSTNLHISIPCMSFWCCNVSLIVLPFCGAADTGTAWFWF